MIKQLSKGEAITQDANYQETNERTLDSLSHTNHQNATYSKEEEKGIFELISLLLLHWNDSNMTPLNT